MSKLLPVVSGRDVVRALSKVGFELLPNSGQGSHMAIAKVGHPAIITVPDHRELDRGTLRSIIRAAGLTVDHLVELLD